MKPRAFWIVILGLIGTVLLIAQVRSSPPTARTHLGGDRDRERIGRSDVAPHAPNVLIVVTDDQRGGLSVMPQTRRWMKKGGTTFTNAFATTPVCCPSRASILTGRYTHNHHVLSNDAEGDRLVQETTLEYYLHRAGYQTALYGKYLNSWPTSQAIPFFDRWADSTKTGVYVNGIWNVNGKVETIPTYNTIYINEQAQQFLDQAAPQASPWFLYLAPAAPHGPFTPEAKYTHAPVSRWEGNKAVFERDPSDKPGFLHFNSEFRDGQKTRRRQFRTLMSVDDLVSEVFDTIKELGQLKNTLVFFISDNGMMWGEHGLKGKRYPYEQSIRVPFLARWPGHIPAGVTDNRIVANIDIAPTVLQAAGIAPAGAYPLDGRTLLRKSSQRNRILTEGYGGINRYRPVPGNWASIRTNHYMYAEYYKKDEMTLRFHEYYDLRTDPWELHNLLGDGNRSNNPDLGALHRRLDRDRRCKGTTGPLACP